LLLLANKVIFISSLEIENISHKTENQLLITVFLRRNHT